MFVQVNISCPDAGLGEWRCREPSAGWECTRALSPTTGMRHVEPHAKAYGVCLY